jgi:hypothetical protein
MPPCSKFKPLVNAIVVTFIGVDC